MSPQPLRIGIDASSILPPRTGVGVYTLNLLRQMIPRQPDLHFVLFMNSLRRPLPRESFLEAPNVTLRRYRLPAPWLYGSWLRLDAPSIERLTGPIDLFHSPSTHIPPQKSGAVVTTINDLYFLRHPEQCHALGGRYLARVLERRLKKIDVIITPTEAVRRDVLELLRVEKSRVLAIPDAVDTQFFRPERDEMRWEALRRELGLTGSRFILAVGTLEPRKNIDGLVAAYQLLTAGKKDLPALVVAGAKGWGTLHPVPPGANIHFPGYLTDEDLRLLYSYCELFVLPSHDEGFGLPILEAMACGAPVVCSDAPAVVEVAGQAALHAASTDVAALVAAMDKVLSDPQVRHDLREKGFRRVRDFSWQACADRTAQVYRQAVRPGAA